MCPLRTAKPGKAFSLCLLLRITLQRMLCPFMIQPPLTRAVVEQLQLSLQLIFGSRIYRKPRLSETWLRTIAPVRQIIRDYYAELSGDYSEI